MDIAKDIIDGKYTLTNLPPKDSSVLFFMIDNYFWEKNDNQLPLAYFLLNYYKTICFKNPSSQESQDTIKNVNEFCDNYIKSKINSQFYYFTPQEIENISSLLKIDHVFSPFTLYTYEKKKGIECEIPFILDLYLKNTQLTPTNFKKIFQYSNKLKGNTKKITQLSILRYLINCYNKMESSNFIFTKYFFTIYLNTPKRIWYFIDKLIKEYPKKKALIEKYKNFKTIVCDQSIIIDKPQFGFLGNLESITLSFKAQKECYPLLIKRILFPVLSPDYSWDEVKSLFYISCCQTFNNIYFIDHAYFDKIPFLANFESIKQGNIYPTILSFAYKLMIDKKYDRGILGLIKRYQTDLHFRNKNTLSMLSSMLIQYYLAGYELKNKKHFFTLVIENEIRHIIKNIDFKIFVDILSNPTKKLKYKNIRNEIELKLHENANNIYTLYYLDNVFDKFYKLIGSRDIFLNKIYKYETVPNSYLIPIKFPEATSKFFDEFYNMLNIKNKEELIAHQILQAFRFRTKRGILKYQKDYKTLPKLGEDTIRSFSDKFFMEKMIRL